jgi:integrase
LTPLSRLNSLLLAVVLALFQLEKSRSINFVGLIKVCIFTGARVSNAAAMRFDEIDWEDSTWKIPRTKNGKPQVVPLVPQALKVIELQKARLKHVDTNYVFPGNGTTGHIVNPARHWHRLCKAAGLTGIRIHDLRRTLGSWQCKTGASLPVIAKTLGHSPGSKATQIYARLDIEPVREAIEEALTALHNGNTARAKKNILGQEELNALAEMVANRLRQQQ